MTFTLNWNTVGVIFAIVSSLIGWLALWRKAAVNEGQQKEDFKTMKKRLEDVEKEAEFLRGCTEKSNNELSKLTTDMGWVKTTLTEIKELVRPK